jgi:glycosyltransferase involved in cell wall biosynthesis
MKPLISVCMPAYNAESYIEDAINSVLKQTYDNWELIIVNDGSKDFTLNKAITYENDARIKVITQENKGQCSASNRAYKESSGDFIKFLDADDIIDTFFLEKMVDNIAGQHCMLFSHCINFYGIIENQKEYTIENWSTMNPFEFLMDDASNMRQGGRWLIPRAIIEKAGLWNESLTLINDHEYFTRLCLASKQVIYVKEAILYYRQVINSLSSQKSLTAFISAYNSILWAGKELLQIEDSQRVRKRIANSFQDLLYRFYPEFPELTQKIEKEINELGGANLRLDGGKPTLFFNELFGWKRTLLLKHWLKKVKAKKLQTQ